jgi:hypothetical protein
MTTPPENLARVEVVRVAKDLVDGVDLASLARDLLVDGARPASLEKAHPDQVEDLASPAKARLEAHGAPPIGPVTIPSGPVEMHGPAMMTVDGLMDLMPIGLAMRQK